jgi:hypothetical protein
MEKRKFLFVSLSALIGDIAWQVSKEGHDVRYYIDNEKERDIADGFVPKSTDWEKDAKWADVIASQGGQSRHWRHRVHRSPGRRSLFRPGRAEESRSQHHPVRGLRLLRSRHRIRQEES